MIKVKKLLSFKKDLNNRLKDPEFRKAWKESEAEYLLDCQKIEKNLNQQHQTSNQCH